MSQESESGLQGKPGSEEVEKEQYRDLPIRKYSKGGQIGGMAPLTSLPPLTRIHPQDSIWFCLGHFVPYQI